MIVRRTVRVVAKILVVAHETLAMELQGNEGSQLDEALLLISRASGLISIWARRFEK